MDSFNVNQVNSSAVRPRPEFPRIMMKRAEARILKTTLLCTIGIVPISSVETTSELDELSRIGLSETDLTLSKYNCFKTVLAKFEVMLIPFFKSSSLAISYTMI
jgi:hypothetical protein